MSDNIPDDKVFGKLVQDEEVRQLVARFIDGTATPEEASQLSEMIVSRPEVCDYHIAQSVLVRQLVSYGATVGAKARLTDKFPKMIRWSNVVRYAVAAAAFLIIGISIFSLNYLPSSKELGRDVVGTILRNDRDEDRLLLLGESVLLDDSKSECSINLDNGVKLVVSGPAKFAVEDLMRCRLWHGRLTADVPQQAIGFRVLTEHADIVDQGTRFGVAVKPDTGTDVAVFEGQVDVASHDRSLKIGSAVTIKPDGSLSRLQLVTADKFESFEMIDPVIISVQDNIRSHEELGYYRVVPRGFGEDKQAYVDRVHQWNGIGKEGIIPELVGGDYVMPFNDDKLREEFQITVTLAKKANLFVLFDDRNHIPGWLSEKFVDSGNDVGQDEGSVPGNITKMRTGIGPGNSVDTVFSVWRSKAPLVGSVTLPGNPIWNGEFAVTEVGPVKNMRSMYGIVAVAVEDGNL